MPGVMSSRMITFKFQASSRGGKVYSDNFESIWSGENRVNIIDNYEDYSKIKIGDSYKYNVLCLFTS